MLDATPGTSLYSRSFPLPVPPGSRIGPGSGSLPPNSPAEAPVDKSDLDKSDLDKSDLDKSDLDKSDLDKSDLDKSDLED